MSEIPQRQAYGMALADYGAINPDVVVLDADVSSSTLTKYFADRFPARFFNLGVTEASMVNVGAGLALGGAIPFVNTFAALLTLRACEQIRTCVAYARTNVKLIGGYSGLSDYKDGPTHFATNDVALMRAMPNIVVLAPADNTEAALLVPIIAEHDGPVYMRISRAAVPDVFGSDHTVRLGQGTTVRPGHDVTIIGSGSMVGRCIQAADLLAGEGIRARVLSMTSIKPFDADLVRQAAEETGALVTAEDHTILGGLGSAVAESLAGGYPAPVEFVGLKDTFAETGPDPDTLMDAWGLGVSDVAAAARRALERRR
ncbi:MAG: transketolase family protein [Anaerolineae bacterium]|nr:transketolase family protein [Anaerolineae bacterium]